MTGAGVVAEHEVEMISLLDFATDTLRRTIPHTSTTLPAARTAAGTSSGRWRR
jgi:hypothetical protein